MATRQEVEIAVSTRNRGKTLHAELITVGQALRAWDEKVEKLWQGRGKFPIEARGDMEALERDNFLDR